MSKGLTALGGHAILTSAPPKCAHARMPFEPGFAHFEFPIVCSSVSLAHSSELSLLRGNAPLAPASPHTPTWHLSYRLSCSSERRFLPHPTHIHSGCLKFYYLFPLPRAGPTKEGREIDPTRTSSSTSLLQIPPHPAYKPRSTSQRPFPHRPGGPRIAITYSRCSRAG